MSKETEEYTIKFYVENDAFENTSLSLNSWRKGFRNLEGVCEENV